MKASAIVSTLVAVSIGCAGTNSTFYPRATLTLPAKKSVNEVEVRSTPPTRACCVLGEIGLGGNAYANYDTLIKVARQNAAAKGADFIFIFKTSAEQRNIVLPGYSSYQGYGTAYGYGFGNSYNATAQYNASGYSVGPRAATVSLPLMNALAGIYYPSRVGVQWDQEKRPKLVVVEFALNSHAQEAGVEIGDEVIGMDGIDVKDENLPRHLLEVQPGQKIRLSIMRSDERRDFDVPTIANN